MVGMLLAGILVGAVAAWFVMRRRSETKENPQHAELAASQLRLQDYAIGQMLKGNVPNFERIADYYRVFHLEFPAQAFMLLVVKLRGYPGAGEPDAQENAYGTVKEELTGILGLSRMRKPNQRKLFRIPRKRPFCRSWRNCISRTVTW